LLLKHREPHRDVEPVDQVLAGGMKILLKPSYAVSAIGEKGYLLVLLHSLRLQQFPQTATRFLIVSLNKSEAFGRGRFVVFLAAERHDTLAGNHLEPPFFVSRSNEATVNSNGHRTIGQRLLFPILIRALEQTNRFFAQSLLNSVRNGVEMTAHGFLIQGVGDGQHVFQ
jgi:hypothetical protein